MSDVVLPNSNTRSQGVPVDVDTETALVQLFSTDLVGDLVPLGDLLRDIFGEDTPGILLVNIQGSLTKTAHTVTAIGDTVLVTPPVGQRIKLYKFSYSADGNNAAGTVVSLKFGDNDPIDKQWLDPKQPYADGLTSRYYLADVDEELTINLSLAVSTGVYVNLAYQFIP